eukprot:GHVU01128595.1.p1 GENE.GHVU01128595.1~~GHVU01128595.1.p1  ORF type:complete len:322 (+),score=46.26 GHVU01128595.1:60-1025(+)
MATGDSADASGTMRLPKNNHCVSAPDGETPSTQTEAASLEEKGHTRLQTRESITGWYRSRRKWCWLATAAVCVVSVLVILLLVFFVVIPKKVQSTIDDSEFVLTRIRVHSPSESSVKIDIEANVTRPLAKAARISGFTAQVVYIEPPGSSSANDEDSLRRPPDGSRLLVEDVHSDWKAGGSSADADASIATTGGLFVGTQQLRHGGGGGRRGIRTSRPVSRIYGVESRQMGTAAPPPDNLIGYMQFPDLSFESTNTQSMVFSTELNITDLAAFNAFTSHLVAKGGALWKLHGITSVHAIGLTFRGIEFSKVLPIEGAKAAR